ncbi:CDGSH iron-sulfur domain-containing protein [soil metagenome]
MSDDITIRVREGGPYMVSGGAPITRIRPLKSEHGESMTWVTTERLESRDIAALCRCGKSGRKPFCDGTHTTESFTGRETAPTNSYDERAKDYARDHLVVRDDRGICEHAGFCGNQATNVWKMVGPAEHDTTVRARMIAMIEHCPSGALTFREPGADTDIEPDLPMGVAVVDDGPLFVTGRIPVERADGQPFETRNRVTLCRCGASKNKPLCDGSHAETGFTDSSH